jgi:hypothetical protein
MRAMPGLTGQTSQVDHTLGKLEEGQNNQRRDIDRIMAKLEDLPRLIRSEFNAEIKEAVDPLRVDVNDLKAKFAVLNDTLLKWKAIFGLVLVVSGAIGAAAAGLTNLKTLVGFFGK